IAKYPTVNLEFKKFVDDGGYQTKEFWIELLEIASLNTDLEGWERIGLFQDRSGRPGPAAWTDGSYQAKDHQPVEGISWFEAKAYCRWKNLRLPSEAEWEYA